MNSQLLFKSSFFVFCRSCQQKIEFKKSSNFEKSTFEQQTFIYKKCDICAYPVYAWTFDGSKKIYTTNKINVVLYEPEIPGNVGTIIRLACAFDLTIHLIEPFGFIYSEKWLGRASAGHFRLAEQKLYSSWKEFLIHNSDGEIVLTSSKAKSSLNKFDFRTLNKPIYLVFGCESKGLPSWLNEKNNYPNIKISQTNLTSSINLAQAVAITTNEVRTQYNFFEANKKNK